MKDNVIKDIIKLETQINKKLIPNNIVIKIFEKNNKEGTIVITKNKELIRVFHFKAIGAFQMEIIENNCIIESGLWIKSLGKWIYNLFNNVDYIYKFYGGSLNNKVLKQNEIENMAIRFEINNENRKFPKRIPIIQGYLRPMYDGIDYGIIFYRYETQEVCNEFSY